MKLVCRQDELSTKLSLLSRVVPANPTHPVLANVLLVAEGHSLALSVFDLNLGMQVSIPAEIETPGTLTLPARFLNEIVSRLPNSDITLEAEETSVTLHCGSGRYQMQGLSADEFPELPTLSDVEPLALSVELVLQGLQSTLFSASTDESKQILTGLHLKGADTGLEFAATDGHRLAIAQFPESQLENPLSVTIPAKALRELERMLSRSPAEVVCRFDTAQVAFEMTTEQGQERVLCRLLEGQYPNYGQLMPNTFSRQITLDRQQFLSGVERIAVLSARKNNIIRMKIDPEQQQLDLSAEAPEFGSGEESLCAQISGDPLEIAFNVKYLSEGLKAMDSQDIQIQLNAETTPAVLSPLSGRKSTYLIMPIQIRG
ncbi:DNA polymerase III subunit beta [Synechococcales cyanobacterium C]|uniref:Beta sliding clamp n=1 Tax=Petrachloros mirabilis ULC683 TaxID=2781853 RepID=A0A8K1ZX18_9CYAN|nr:DNA polymerase III subunit beta [Petrachloros mirabilis]NCJ06468.1 DNA polymerase III subunit beta [Petrachloros mirabilis ULC683]